MTTGLHVTADLEPRITVEQWMDDAKCVGEPLDVFFIELGDDYSTARAICEDCPVRRECLAFAIRTGANHGMFGGMSPRERAEQPTSRYISGPPDVPDLFEASVPTLALRYGVGERTIHRWRMTVREAS